VKINWLRIEATVIAALIALALLEALRSLL
jgi:Flp pilus assembly pilin Flp